MSNIYRNAVLELFEENFQKYKDKKIAIYGTGLIAGYIIEKFSDYNIIGFLDGKKKYGTVYGKKILSYEEIVKYKPDIIIVAATKNNMQAIYDRICYMCYTNKISIYAIDGRNLFTVFGYIGLTDEQKQYEETSEVKLKQEIKKHDIISFDIFDVVIMRKTLEKSDVFDIVEDKLRRENIYIHKYKEMRQKCENEVINEFGTIYDIYLKLIKYTGITEEIANKVLNIELEVEKNIFCCREKIKELLLFAVESGKQVYLIEDSYFPPNIIKSILEKYGIIQYNDILLSCEYSKTKEEGLYNIIRDKAKGNAYLHIGKSDKMDLGYAENNYIDTFMLKSAYDMFCMSSYRNLLYSLDSINERSMLGMLIAKIFNSPFSLYHAEERPEIDCIYDFGYIFIAPLISKYVLWIVDKVKDGQFTDVLFAARDGFITYKLYDFVVRELKLNIPKGIYFHTSRNICIKASVKDEVDIRWILNVPYDDLSVMLGRRFNLDDDDVTYNKDINLDIVSYVLQFKDKILKKTEILRNNYLKYMRKNGLKKDVKYAFVDFVSCGSCQVLLNKFIPFNIEGLYFGWYRVNDEAKMMLPTQALYKNLAEEYDVYCSYAYENYLFLETIMTSLEASVENIDVDGKPVFGMDYRTEEEFQYVKDIHMAIEDYFCDYINNLYVKDSEINKYFVDTIFNYRESQYTNEHCSIFDKLTLFDDLRQKKRVFCRK